MRTPLPRSLSCACAAVAMVLLTHLACAESIRYGMSGRPLRWRAERVEFLVDRGTPEPGIPDPLAAVRAAAEVWSEVPGATRIDAREGSLGAPGFNAAGPNRSGMAYYRSGFPVATPALALTLLTADAETDAILDADVIIQGARNPIAQLGPEGLLGMPNAPYDFQALMTHELGHVLGLDEDPVHPEATMYPHARRGDVGQRTLSAHDKAALQRAYAPMPEDPPAEGGCGATVAPGPRRSVPGLALAGIVALLAAALRPRARRGWCAVGAVLLTAGAPGSGAEPAASAVVLRAETRRVHGMLITTATLERDGTVFDVDALGGTLHGLRQRVLHAPSGDDLLPGARVTVEGAHVLAVMPPWARR